MSSSKKIGLALGSGGGRGLVHLGVLRSLVKHDIKIDYIAGASIGSLIGAMYSALLDVDEIESRLLNNQWKSFGAFIDPTMFSGGAVSGKKLEKLVDDFIGVSSFSDLKIPLVAVASDLVSGDQIKMQEGDLAMAVRASMSVPSVFKPVEYNGARLVDGGVINPVPADVAREMGADIVLAVNLDHRKNTAVKDFKFVSRVVVRTLNIVRHYLAEYSLKAADMVLNPEFDEEGMISLSLYADKKKAAAVIKMGEEMMDARIDELKKILDSK